MRSIVRLVGMVCSAALAAGVTVVLPGAVVAAPTHVHGEAAVCPVPAPGLARCNAHVVTLDGQPDSSASFTPGGYAPADLQAAYGLPSASAGAGQTVAIVDAYDDPTAQADLDAYRAQFGLSACDAGCFHKVDQNGGTNYPAGNTGWAEEISLDLDMVSAVCPNCHILLVEASSNFLTDLGTAVNRAALMGANEISNSYGGGESSSDTSFDSQYYNHPGVAVTASSGDNGYGVEYPAASRNVTAVGGTTLKRASTNRGFTETAWSGAGSGCSRYDTKPGWQHDTGCSRRTVADVSADADPNTGVAVYDTDGQGGWLVFGGTSVASPIIASVYALAGNAASVTYGAYPYSHTAQLFDISSGRNGRCKPAYLCTALTGYDGPTGLGTPHGVTGF